MTPRVWIQVCARACVKPRPLTLFPSRPQREVPSFVDPCGCLALPKPPLPSCLFMSAAAASHNRSPRTARTARSIHWASLHTTETTLLPSISGSACQTSLDSCHSGLLCASQAAQPFLHTDSDTADRHLVLAPVKRRLSHCCPFSSSSFSSTAFSFLLSAIPTFFQYGHTRSMMCFAIRFIWQYDRGVRPQRDLVWVFEGRSERQIQSRPQWPSHAQALGDKQWRISIKVTDRLLGWAAGGRRVPASQASL